MVLGGTVLDGSTEHRTSLSFGNGRHLAVLVDLGLDHIAYLYLLAHFRRQRNWHFTVLMISYNVLFAALDASCCRSIISRQFTPHGVSGTGSGSRHGADSLVRNWDTSRTRQLHTRISD